MSLTTSDAKEYRSMTSMTLQWVSQSQPKRSLRAFSVLRHPNHLLLARMNNRNVIITQRFHAAPVRDFFLVHDWLHIWTVSTFPYICRVNFLFEVLVFIFPLFLGMAMYATEVETKEKSKFTWEKKIKNNIYERATTMMPPRDPFRGKNLTRWENDPLRSISK